MTPDRFEQITSRYRQLRIAVVGDFCLDRYLEIDPFQKETSIETGLPVHNVVNVRSQPGAAGTVLNNLDALGVGTIIPIGFVGEDGEGYELLHALNRKAHAEMRYFVETPHRRTFTYCKPLVVTPGELPVELSRLDSKNWTPTPPMVEARLIANIRAALRHAHALIILDQVDVHDTGVVTKNVLTALVDMVRQQPDLVVLADSRKRIASFPHFSLKMNRPEFCYMAGLLPGASLEEIRDKASTIALLQTRNLFITLAEEGILAATSDGQLIHRPALPVRGPIDVVGAGDSVTANLVAAWATGAALAEVVEFAMAASSIVIHQLGTTGTAGVAGIRELMVSAS
jgi:rfaE bifunctional protein kinase chain/domain